MLKTLLGLVFALVVCSCAKQSSTNGQTQNNNNEQVKSNSGIKIEYGPNLGASHTDEHGVEHFYVHSTAIITNDSIVPIHVQCMLSKAYEFPAFCGDSTYQVFLLPEQLTPDTTTIYNSIVNGQHDFLNNPLSTPATLNKTLDPGDNCVVTIGVLIRKPANCAAVPRAIFTHDERGLHQKCDIELNQAISADFKLQLGVKLEYYYRRKFIAPGDGCVVIPFGQISYPEH